GGGAGEGAAWEGAADRGAVGMGRWRVVRALATAAAAALGATTSIRCAADLLSPCQAREEAALARAADRRAFGMPHRRVARAPATAAAAPLRAPTSIRCAAAASPSGQRRRTKARPRARAARKAATPARIQGPRPECF